ncbi:MULTISPECIES: class I SAM-dependent methyltransferase [unclassified Ruminococcus]|uniref:class I SAM-dependent methyltransferase n=1 Tax=unclassified Ruminococcus TaxID=2608920 RepID=UPI00210D6C71|nr:MULTISPECIES: class I SAM-dependent methyltransferase [unclassified Ruminococcus]
MNSNEIKLDRRLSLCAEFVRQGATVADIGTDHAYLPVYLIQSGKINSAIAADINEGPLKSGIETIKQYSLSDKISARLSNGLEKIRADECSDIVIAGMGGELICSIIEAAQWLKSSDKHLILQPMTRPEVLRSYLCQNGFEIMREQAVESDGRIYTVMLVCFCNTTVVLSDFSARVGKLNPAERKLDRMYLERVVASLQKKHKGLLCGGNKNIAADLADTINKINSFINGGQNDYC